MGGGRNAEKGRKLSKDGWGVARALPVEEGQLKEEEWNLDDSKWGKREKVEVPHPPPLLLGKLRPVKL